MRVAFMLSITCLLLIGCQELNKVDTPRKQINIEPDFINFSGTWHSLTQTPYFIKLPKVNAVSGSCSKQTMSCKEMVALLYNPKTDKSIADYPMLYVQENNYQIIEWSPSVISARAEYPVADIELRISPLDKSIEKTYRETKKRGAETSDPDIVISYILQ